MRWLRSNGTQGRRRLGDHQAVGRRRDLGAAEPIGQGDHPKRKRDRAENVRTSAPIGSAREPQPDDLGRAPADVEDDGVRDARMEQRGAAGDDETRLFPTRDDLDLEPDLLVHPGEKRLAIRRAAAGFGRHIASGGDLAGNDLLGANSQRVEGARHCNIARARRSRPALRRAGRCGKTRRRRESPRRPAARPAADNYSFPRSSAARWRAKRCTTRGDAAVPPKSSGARGSGRNATSAAAPTGPAARGSSRCHAGVVAPPPTDPLLLSGFSTAGVPSRSHARPAMLAQPGSKSKPRKCLRFQPGRPSTQRRVGMISDDRVSERFRRGEAALRSRLGDRLTVGQRTLTPPV